MRLLREAGNAEGAEIGIEVFERRIERQDLDILPSPRCGERREGRIPRRIMLARDIKPVQGLGEADRPQMRGRRSSMKLSFPARIRHKPSEGMAPSAQSRAAAKGE